MTPLNWKRNASPKIDRNFSTSWSTYIIKKMGACISSKVCVTEEKVAPFSRDDNIAVVGAGAGGLHLASVLIKKGKHIVTWIWKVQILETVYSEVWSIFGPFWQFLPVFFCGGNSAFSATAPRCLPGGPMYSLKNIKGHIQNFVQVLVKNTKVLNQTDHWTVYLNSKNGSKREDVN